MEFLDGFLKYTRLDLVKATGPNAVERYLGPISILIVAMTYMAYFYRVDVSVIVVYLVMAGATELLKQSPEFTSGLWSVDGVTWWYECHAASPILSGICLLFAVMGMYEAYERLESRVHAPAMPMDVGLENKLKREGCFVAFGLSGVVLCAAGPILKSVAFILYVLFYGIGLIAFGVKLHEEGQKHIAAASASTAGGVGTSGSVIISNNSVNNVSKFWVTHMVGKNLNDKMDLDDFTANCQHPVTASRNNQKMSLFKAKLELAGYTVNERRTIIVPAPP